MSIVPIATERSPWPPGFSLVNIVFQILCGSRLSPLSSTSDAGVGFQDARDEALAHQLALAVAAVGVEAVADHRLAVADHVGDDGHEAQRHLAEVDVGVADGRADGDGLLADFDDLHGGLLMWFGCESLNGPPGRRFRPMLFFSSSDALDEPRHEPDLARRLPGAGGHRQLLARGRRAPHDRSPRSAGAFARWRSGSAPTCSTAARSRRTLTEAGEWFARRRRRN